MTPPEKERLPVRSFRVSSEVWGTAKKRAESEGKTISQVVSLLVEAYATRLIDAPRIVLVVGEGADERRSDLL